MNENVEAILMVRVDGRKVVTIASDQVPCEVTADVQLSGVTTVALRSVDRLNSRKASPSKVNLSAE